MTTENKAQPPQDDMWAGYYDWDTSTQIGLGTGIVSAPIALGLAEMLGMGLSGFVVAAIIGGGGFLAGKALSEKQGGQGFPLPIVEKLRNANWKALLVEMPEQVAVSDDQAPAQSATSAALPETPTPTSEEDSVFASAQLRNEPGIRRITVDEMVAKTVRNSYEVWIGRSLTGPGNRAIKINFHKRHIKLIGATQHGKSSMAAALIEAIMRTHDPEKVMFALLDLENKTSRLFANADHIAELLIGDKVIPLHAKSPEEVARHLEYLLQLIEYRYDLSEQEIDELPLVIAYLEEFIELKDYFKQLILEAKNKDAEDLAKKRYERLLHCIRKIARMGLKVHVQLLMCAQVDYVDEDLREALANVTSGMAFCVRPSAARAAGFMQEKLMAKNAQDDQVGQCVVEMPECKDLVLAPEYPLRDKLKALGSRERIYQKAALVNVEMPIYTPVNDSVNGSTGSFTPQPAKPHLQLLGNDQAERETPGEIPAAVNVNADTRKVIKRLVDMGTIPHNKIAKAVGLDGRNYSLYKQVCREMGIATEKEA